MSTFVTRSAAGLLGAAAFTGLAGGVAHADEAPAPDAAHGASATGPTWVLQEVPVPLPEPTLGLFDALAPAYDLLGGLG
ncbi:MAG: hypothetical protein OJJ54_01355 [Pseudonocardia sp.]|nr:hypothetical protein [Pseudonocardia sp.]